MLYLENMMNETDAELEQRAEMGMGDGGWDRLERERDPTGRLRGLRVLQRELSGGGEQRKEVEEGEEEEEEEEIEIVEVRQGGKGVEHGHGHEVGQTQEHEHLEDGERKGPEDADGAGAIGRTGEADKGEDETAMDIDSDIDIVALRTDARPGTAVPTEPSSSIPRTVSPTLPATSDTTTSSVIQSLRDEVATLRSQVEALRKAQEERDEQDRLERVGRAERAVRAETEARDNEKINGNGNDEQSAMVSGSIGVLSEEQEKRIIEAARAATREDFGAMVKRVSLETNSGDLGPAPEAQVSCSVWFRPFIMVFLDGGSSTHDDGSARGVHEQKLYLYLYMTHMLTRNRRSSVRSPPCRITRPTVIRVQ